MGGHGDPGGARFFFGLYSAKTGFLTNSHVVYSPLLKHTPPSRERMTSESPVSSPLLPQAPEYDDGSLVLDEIVPDEDL